MGTRSRSEESFRREIQSLQRKLDASNRIATEEIRKLREEVAVQRELKRVALEGQAKMVGIIENLSVRLAQGEGRKP